MNRNTCPLIGLATLIRTRSCRAVVLALCCLCVSVASASATQFTVNSTSDLPDAAPGDGACAAADGSCTLRAAVMEASKYSGDSHVIDIPAGTYRLTGRHWEDEGETGDLDIRVPAGSGKRITIRGAGPPSRYCGGVCAPPVSGQHTIIVGPADGEGDRIFDIGPDAGVVMANLAITGGNVRLPNYRGNDCSGQIDTTGLTTIEEICLSGGGIRSLSPLMLDNVAIYANAAREGGGIHSMHSLTLTSVAVIGNISQITEPRPYGRSEWQMPLCGGGVLHTHGRLVVRNSAIDNNSSNSGGGGICTFDTTEIWRTRISGNMSWHDGDGGGIYARMRPTNINGTFLMFDSNVHDNLVYNGNGGGLSLNGRGELHRVRVERNRAVDDSDRAFPNAHGGGIALGTFERLENLLEPDRALRATDLTVADNRSDGYGGGLFLTSAVGGLGLTEIIGATISSNRSGLEGGGVYAGLHNVWLTNVTISANSTTPSGLWKPGAGLALEYSYSQLFYTTIAFNASNTGGALYVRGGRVILKANLFSRNYPVTGGCLFDYSTYWDYGGNLDDSGTCPSDEPAELVSRTARLDPILRHNGGWTKTHALRDGSIAIDRAPDCGDVYGRPLTVDQRGLPRPSGARCDVGAYELFPLNLSVWRDLFGDLGLSLVVMLDDARLMQAEMGNENNGNVHQADSLVGELELASEKVRMFAAASDPRAARAVADDVANQLARVEEARLAFDRQSLDPHAARWTSLGGLMARSRQQLAAFLNEREQQ